MVKDSMLKDKIEDSINKIIPEILDLRKTLHENAEVSLQEFKTQIILMDYLNKNGIENFPCASTGIIGIMNPDDSHYEVIAVRADMDALAVNGASHLCGHDYHMAILLGVSRVLKELGFSKKLKLIFQPAEETFGGADRMITAGVLENPKVEKIIGFHVWPGVKVGTIEITGGASMASVNDFEIKFIGKGGHAAFPHKCINPIFPAIEFIQTITSKVSREHDPNNSYVLTFSAINGGEVFNVIASDVTVLGTFRTFDEVLRSDIKNKLEVYAKTFGDIHGCEVEIKYDFAYPPLVSDKNFTEDFIKTAKVALGESNVLPLEKSFAAEDFSFFCEKIPSVHFRLGIDDGTLGSAPLHAPNFSANDNCIFYGISAIVHYLMK